MMVYVVKHEYDVDGGYGDAVRVDDIVAIFESETDAQRFVEKYSNPHVYDTPYNDLYCGELTIMRIDVIPEGDPDQKANIDKKDLWWRDL